jgi:hypothetical protein
MIIILSAQHIIIISMWTLAMLNSLICNLSDTELAIKLKRAESELTHCMYCHEDPLEALEWLDLYRRELALRQARVID